MKDGRRAIHPEFKIAMVKQITQKEHSIPDAARRCWINNKSIYNWWTSNVDNAPEYEANQAQEDELKRLQAELKRVTQVSGYSRLVFSLSNRLVFEQSS